MEFFINIFNTFLYQPFFNILILLYQVIPGQDFGVAIIIFTILVRLLFYPLTTSAVKSQKVMAELQPKIQEIQQRFKQNKEEQAREIMAFYQKEKVSPFSGCLPVLIQLPILIALFQVFIRGFGPEQMIFLYSFIPHPGTVNLFSFNRINLGEANVFIAIFAGVAQFFQSKMLVPKVQKIKKDDNQVAQVAVIVQKQMLYITPVFTIFILLGLPSAVALYWLIAALFSILQQYLILQ